MKDDTTITVSWTPPSPTPTGYVIYYQATDGGTDSGNETVTGGSTDQEVITDRNRGSYDITIMATSNHLPSTVVGPVGTTREWICCFYSRIFCNRMHSILLVSMINVPCVAIKNDPCMLGLHCLQNEPWMLY